MENDGGMERKIRRRDTVAIDGLRARELRVSRPDRPSQADIAEVAGVTAGYYAQVERGLRDRVSRSTAEGIAAALGKTVDDLRLERPKDSDTVGLLATPRGKAGLLRDAVLDQVIEPILSRLAQLEERQDLILQKLDRLTGQHDR